jgi:energy-coupling factor transporter ATP-binding protein EcfA2
VAITDHHTIDVQRVHRLQSLGGSDLLVLPGIELRTDLGGKESIHLIGIFPEDCDLSSLWTKLQGQLGLTPDDISRIGHESVYVPFTKAAETIHSLGGLVSVHGGRKSNSFENIGNNKAFKTQLKRDLVNRHIDFIEITRAEDETDYEQNVFPSIGRIPLVSGSDCHDISQYGSRLQLWIKADTTFRGLQQVANEPETRRYLGTEPEQLSRVRENGTKYIDAITIRKTYGSNLAEAWFDCSLPLNPGLVAVIGNKGSGKSALADILGLLGDTRQHKHFSFLSPGKFKGGKTQRAHHFEARLDWASGPPTAFRNLNSDISPESIESIKYLPQSYVESVCNDVNSTDSTSAFDRELDSVIFSHVPRASRLGTISLEQLIKLKTEETNSELIKLRSILAEINDEIALLEQMDTKSYSERLTNEKAGLMRELDAHLALKPTEVIRPELDERAQAEMSETSHLIESESKKLMEVRSEITEMQQAEEESAMLVVTRKKLLSQLKTLESDFERLRTESGAECASIGVTFDDLVTLTVNASPVIEAIEAAERTRTEASKMLDELNPEGLFAKLSAINTNISTLTSKLDSAGRKYQEYSASLARWKERIAMLEGDESTPGTIKYVDLKLSELPQVAARIAEREAKRREISIKIYKAISLLCDEYRDLYTPVQSFITKYAKLHKGIELDFKVHIQAHDFARTFLGWINQAKRGSFYGAEDGATLLRQLQGSADFSDADGSLEFAENIVNHLKQDHRESTKKRMNVSDQLKQSVEVTTVYDFLFGFEYLQPKYQLQWAGQPLQILSPGERGTVLLLFYLLVDKGDHPLIIDQPEENLDNQTVYPRGTP